jgi:hypothetical protein
MNIIISENIYLLEVKISDAKDVTHNSSYLMQVVINITCGWRKIRLWFVLYMQYLGLIGSE